MPSILVVVAAAGLEVLARERGGLRVLGTVRSLAALRAAMTAYAGQIEIAPGSLTVEIGPSLDFPAHITDDPVILSLCCTLRTPGWRREILPAG